MSATSMKDIPLLKLQSSNIGSTSSDARELNYYECLNSYKEENSRLLNAHFGFKSVWKKPCKK